MSENRGAESQKRLACCSSFVAVAVLLTACAASRTYFDAAAPTRTAEEVQAGVEPLAPILLAKLHRYFQDRPYPGQGLILLDITIAPDGTVEDCRLVSSNLGHPQFENLVVERVKALNFGARNVPAYTYSGYPIRIIPR